MRNLSLKLTKALFGAFLLTGYGLAYAKAASFNAPLDEGPFSRLLQSPHPRIPTIHSQ